MWVLATASHAILAPRLRLIPVSGSSLSRVHPGMRSIHPYKCHGHESSVAVHLSRFGACQVRHTQAIASHMQRHMGASALPCYAPPHAVLF